MLCFAAFDIIYGSYAKGLVRLKIIFNITNYLHKHNKKSEIPPGKQPSQNQHFGDQHRNAQHVAAAFRQIEAQGLNAQKLGRSV